MIAKLVMLALMTVFAIVALLSSKLVSVKKYGNGVYRNRRVMRLRLICFVLMFVCLLVCLLI